jgi:serine/threonine-protein kinase
MIGELLDDKYEILRLIGEGGMGAVYEARHKTTGRKGAVKVISNEEVASNEMLIARFEREAQAAAKVQSAHIVEILDAGHDRKTGTPYMVMELLVGTSVHALLRKLGPLPPELAVRIAVQTCFGLEKAHEVGVVHRDIKPANLFLSEGDGDELTVKLLDFGVAKFKMDQATEGGTESLTRTGSMLGSPLYMSPEQARGLKTIDFRADIWSLGIVLFQLLCGKAPHAGIDGLGELIITICSDEPPPLRTRAPWISPGLERVVQRALRLVPGDRHPSVRYMRDALTELLPTADAWRVTRGMLVSLTDTDRAARPTDDVDDNAATVALDPSGANATIALDAGEVSEAAAPPPPPAKTEVPATESSARSDSAAKRTSGASAEGSRHEATRARKAVSAASKPEQVTSSGLGLALGTVVIGLLLGGVAIYFVRFRQAEPPPTASATAQSSVAAPAASTASTIPASTASSGASAGSFASPSATATASSAIRNRIKILGKRATVTLDGKRADIDGEGYVAVDAKLGDTVTVAVSSAAGTTVRNVRMTETGPVPSEIAAK